MNKYIFETTLVYPTLWIKGIKPEKRFVDFTLTNTLKSRKSIILVNSFYYCKELLYHNLIDLNHSILI